MRTYVTLAAILVALALLASASFAGLGYNAQDGSGTHQPPAGTAPAATAAPATAPAVSTDPVPSGPIGPTENPVAGDRIQLERTAYNLNKIGGAIVQETSPGMIKQASDAVDYEVEATNQYLIKRQIIRQSLTAPQLLLLLRKLGYWGGATWGRSEVDYALRTKILRGRTYGTTVNSTEWRQFLTREEFAVGLMRTLQAAKDYTDAAIISHNSDPSAHAALRAALEARMDEKLRPFNILGCVLGSLLALVAITVIILVLKKAMTPTPAVAATPAQAPPVQTPPAPAVNNAGGQPPAPFQPVTPARNNSGITYARS